MVHTVLVQYLMLDFVQVAVNTHSVLCRRLKGFQIFNCVSNGLQTNIRSLGREKRYELLPSLNTVNDLHIGHFRNNQGVCLPHNKPMKLNSIIHKSNLWIQIMQLPYSRHSQYKISFHDHNYTYIILKFNHTHDNLQ